jgi:hypothetical protein
MANSVWKSYSETARVMERLSLRLSHPSCGSMASLGASLPMNLFRGPGPLAPACTGTGADFGPLASDVAAAELELSTGCGVIAPW